MLAMLIQNLISSDCCGSSFYIWLGSKRKQYPVIFINPFIISRSNDETMKLWDVRMFKKYINRVEGKKENVCDVDIHLYFTPFWFFAATQH